MKYSLETDRQTNSGVLVIAFRFYLKGTELLKVEKLVLQDRRVILRLVRPILNKRLSEILKISFGSIQSILTGSLGF